MADHQGKESETPSTGCGMFDFLKKPNEEKLVEVVKPEVEEKREPTIVEKLHCLDGSSSSSSDEEEEGKEGVEKKKKKKGLNEKLKEKEKVSGHGDDKKEEHNHETVVPIQKHEQTINAEEMHTEEKKGLMEKMKEKLPGQHKKDEVDVSHPEGEPKEKGFLDKIKEKLPGAQKHVQLEEKKGH